MDEGAALEKRYTFARIAGSNPALSAIHSSIDVLVMDRQQSLLVFQNRMLAPAFPPGFGGLALPSC